MWIVLPFGLRSALKIFTAVSDWNQGVSNSIHYLDDFSVLGKSKAECQLNLDIILQYCQTLGVPVKQKAPLRDLHS